MDNKTILFIGLGAATLAVLRNKDKKPATNPTSIDVADTLVDLKAQDMVKDLIVSGDEDVFLSGGDSITIDSTPDYNTWQFGQWVNFYKMQVKSKGFNNAIDIVWQLWDNERNRYRHKLPSALHLERMLSLSQSKNKAVVGLFNVTENDLPVYDTWHNYRNNITPWNCPDWKNWFDKMATAWGVKTAQQRFASAWVDDKNWQLGSNGWSCSQNCDFIESMNQRGINVADFGMTTFCNFTYIPHNLVQATRNVSQGVADTSKVASKMMPILFIGGVGLLIYKGYQQVK